MRGRGSWKKSVCGEIKLQICGEDVAGVCDLGAEVTSDGISCFFARGVGVVAGWVLCSMLCFSISYSCGHT